MRSGTATGTGGPGAKARRMVAAMVMTAASDGERVEQEGRGRTASSKVGKKPRMGLVHGVAKGRKLRVFLWPSHSVVR